MGGRPERQWRRKASQGRSDPQRSLNVLTTRAGGMEHGVQHKRFVEDVQRFSALLPQQGLVRQQRLFLYNSLGTSQADKIRKVIDLQCSVNGFTQILPPIRSIEKVAPRA